VCLLRGLSPSQVQEQLTVIRQQLAAVPNFAANLAVGYAILQGGETIQNVLARAADPGGRD